MAKKTSKSNTLKTRTVSPTTRDPGYACPNCGGSDTLRESGRVDNRANFSCINCGHVQVRIF